jgi:hypothetical protein
LPGTYQKVFPEETHESVGKANGQTNQMERWYNRLRQSNARFVRKTLSLSKSYTMHEIVTRLFIVQSAVTNAFDPKTRKYRRFCIHQIKGEQFHLSGFK